MITTSKLRELWRRNRSAKPSPTSTSMPLNAVKGGASAEDGPKPYIYQPLRRSDTIRVLKLFPGKIGDLLECEICETLHEDGGYQALSYVWGSTQKPFRIIVRSGSGTEGYIPLGHNLYHALQDLRACNDIPDKTFWIDGICINQKDSSEKSQQVAMMARIFSNADRTFTYLGPASDNILQEKEGIRLLTKLHELFSPYEKIFYDMEHFYRIFSESKSIAGLKLPPDISQGYRPEFLPWRWLVELAFGEWTQRLWVVQEQVLNRQTTMLRGQRLIPWLAVGAAILLFYVDVLPWEEVTLYFADMPDTGNWIRPALVVKGVYYMWRHRWAHEQANQGFQREKYTDHLTGNPLTQVITEYAHLRSFDPRDQIFALLSLCNDADELGLVPDYSRSTTDIFVNTSTRIFKQTTTSHNWLLLLATTADNSHNSSFPSWALKPHPDHRKMCQFKSGPGVNLEIAFTVDRTLTLKGCPVAMVTFSTPPVYFNHSISVGLDDEATSTIHLRLLGNWTKVLLKVGVTLDNFYLFCRCLYPGYPDPGIPSEYSDRRKALAFPAWLDIRQRYTTVLHFPGDLTLHCNRAAVLNDTRRVITELAGFFFAESDSTFLDPDAPLTSDEEAAIGHVFSWIRWRGRSFGIDSLGRIFNASHETKYGDSFMAIKGCEDRLWVLRAVEGGCYRLIGDAYVPGLMSVDAPPLMYPGYAYHDIQIK